MTVGAEGRPLFVSISTNSLKNPCAHAALAQAVEQGVAIPLGEDCFAVSEATAQVIRNSDKNGSPPK